ncbi:PLDc_N domain-containing protein [Microbispora sp. NEAU-D428]|uniref:PLD nuclease N-terminal domain-containing protein n=1 Tax=Microbispora sitophila TaxID=2771537 RepID=UPI0018690B40|nr:PLD nuclease N-terminal domain-containing protein [Microbispora sitophila]MBE3008701.1 PLDc_N domain-containing protein [Microbispora sitophila]
MPSVIIGLALLALWLYCLFDVITTPEEDVRNLPKFMWVLIVIFLADVGALTWLLVGRPRARHAMYAAGGDRWVQSGDAPRGPDDDPEFLRSLERRLRDED